KEDEELSKQYQMYVEGGEVNTRVKERAATFTSKFTSDYVLDLLRGGDGPIIVFSDHLKPLSAIGEFLTKKKYKVDYITGSVEVEERQKIINRFQRKELDVILLTYGAGST